MKYLFTLMVTVLVFANATYAVNSQDAEKIFPPEVLLAYEQAKSALPVHISSRESEVSYEYRIAYDDQPIAFTFTGAYQECVVEVGSESLKVHSISCRSK